jgi:hypothetical protein
VQVIRHERPAEAFRSAGREEVAQALEQIAAIDVVREDAAPFDSAGPYVVEDARSVEAGLAGQGVPSGGPEGGAWTA